MKKLGEYVANDDVSMRFYETAEDYIHGEYGGEVGIVVGILERLLPSEMSAIGQERRNRVALEIAGYYTGCLGADGKWRRGRPVRSIQTG